MIFDFRSQLKEFSSKGTLGSPYQGQSLEQGSRSSLRVARGKQCREKQFPAVRRAAWAMQCGADATMHLFQTRTRTALRVNSMPTVGFRWW